MIMEHHGNNTPSVVIRSIKFNNGTKVEFENDDIVLLVGANNVGKSRILKDLREDLNESSKPKVLVSEVEYKTTNFASNTIKKYFERNISRDSFGNYNVLIDESNGYSFDESSFGDVSNESFYYKVLFSFLSTENRLNITRPIIFNSNVDNASLNIIKKLENDSESINMLNKVLDLGFKKGIDVSEDYLDNTIIKKYKISDSQDIKEIIGLNRRESLNELTKLEDLHTQGDGIRSAVAILASLIVNEHSLFLIDEPETFLHPPQARALGKNIVELSRNKQCFISTHNIDFIRGVLEEDASRVKIIKIDRVANDNEFNLVDNDSIVEIANDKNLKYTNILDGLFYSQLVLCEDESDCKFYSAILEHLKLHIYQNTLFCAVGGKDQFKKVIPLLRELNIQYLVIADIDLINNKENLKQLLNSVDPDSYKQIMNEHTRFLEKFEQEMNSQVKTQERIKFEIKNVFNGDKYMSPAAVEQIKSILKNVSSFKLLKHGGKKILPQGECTALFNQIKKYLNEHKIFILECGEIERFVPEVNGHGNTWVENTFTRYENIDDDVYEEARKFIKTVFNI